MNRLVDSDKLAFRGTTPRGGVSNKVYIIEIIEVDDTGTYHVVGWNGPRGGTLTRQQKTTTPVSYARARAIYDEVVGTRLSHRYQYDPDVPDTRLPSQRTPATPAATPAVRPAAPARPTTAATSRTRATARRRPAREEEADEQPPQTDAAAQQKPKDRFDALEF